jgi:hypothetical protein
MTTRLALGLAIVLSACGGEGGGSMLGAWGGEWTSTRGATGSLQTNFTEDDGDHFEGSIQFSGTDCFSGAAITGDLNGRAITGNISAAGIAMDYSATLDGTRMTGSYDITAAGICTGDTGTFTLDKR